MGKISFGNTGRGLGAQLAPDAQCRKHQGDRRKRQRLCRLTQRTIVCVVVALRHMVEEEAEQKEPQYDQGCCPGVYPRPRRASVVVGVSTRQPVSRHVSDYIEVSDTISCLICPRAMVTVKPPPKAAQRKRRPT